jgi:hypothetical protein
LEEPETPVHKSDKSYANNNRIQYNIYPVNIDLDTLPSLIINPVEGPNENSVILLTPRS